MKFIEKLKPSKIKEKITEYRRVIEVAKKPDKEELTSSMKITGIGIALLGVVGFIISVLYILLTGM